MPIESLAIFPSKILQKAIEEPNTKSCHVLSILCPTPRQTVEPKLLKWLTEVLERHNDVPRCQIQNYGPSILIYVHSLGNRAFTYRYMYLC